MNFTLQHFWFALTVASLLWYTFVTVYVAWHGLADIRQMLRNLRSQGREQLPEDGT